MADESRATGAEAPGGEPEPAAAGGDWRADRGVARRRLVLAAVASAIVHFCLYGGLSATHIGLLDGRPRDPDQDRPSLVPKMAADYPLTVQRSPAAAPEHERPLEMAPSPAAPPERPRAEPEKVVDRSQPPEQAPEPAAAKPDLERTARTDEIAAQEAAALARREAKAPAAAAAAADRVKLEAGKESRAAAPKPAALEPRGRPAADAAVDRREASAAEAAVEAAAPGPMESRRIASAVPTPSPAAMVRPVERRAATAVTAAPEAAADVPAAGGPLAAAVEPKAARPQPSAAGGVAARGGSPRSAVRTRPTDTSSAAADAAEGSAGASTVATLRPLAPLAAGQASRAAAAGAGPAAPAAMAGAAPLARAAPAAAGPPGDGGDAVAAAAPARASAASSTSAAASGGGGAPGPAPAAGSRLAMRSTGRGGATGSGRAGPAAISGRGGAGDDAEESLSVGDAGPSQASAPRRATGLASGRPGGRGAATATAADGGGTAGATGTAPLAAQPLARNNSFALPAAGRDREVALPFARRSRANRDAAGKGSAESDVVVRPKTRAAADAMIDRGLEFLARAQAPDGRWKLESYPGSQPDSPRLVSDTAATGLAILSFLGAGHDHFDGRHRDTVRRGLEFLLSVQKPDGDLYVPGDQLSDSCAWLYSHGIASMALCEAVGMTGDPLVKPAAAKACRFITTSQHPSRGGWRYTPGSDSDLSVSGWMLVALRAGTLAGVDVDPRGLAGVRTLLEQSVAAGDPTKYLYNPVSPQQRPSRLSSACMTAVGTLGRLHTGWSKSDPRVRQAAARLLEIEPVYGSATQRTRDCYLWYYASQVLVHTGGDPWADWFDTLAGQLEKSQERFGPIAGSWDPLGKIPDRWGAYGGRIYVTCLHLLTLEVPDRRLPTYGSPEDVNAAAGSKP